MNILQAKRAELVRYYRPLDATAYLRTHGWQLTETAPRFSMWTKTARDGEPYEILLPLALDAADLPQRISDFVQTLVTDERRPEADVWEDLTQPSCDVFRVRLLANEDGQSLPLEDGADAFQHARDLVLAAACATIRPSPVYGPRKPDRAVDLVRRTRLGQTRPGSYIIKIIAPLAEPTSVASFDDGVPFTRQATLKLTSGLQAVLHGLQQVASTGEMAHLQGAVEHGVSANFCAALAGLCRIGNGVTFSFSWAATLAPPPATVSHWSLPTDTVGYLQQAAQWFRRTATLEEVEFYGSVQKLERVTDSEDLVTLVGVIDEQRRTVRCRAAADIRTLLTKAHHDRLPVTGTGELLKEGKQYFLRNVRNVRVLEEVDDGSVT